MFLSYVKLIDASNTVTNIVYWKQILQPSIRLDVSKVSVIAYDEDELRVRVSRAAECSFRCCCKTATKHMSTTEIEQPTTMMEIVSTKVVALGINYVPCLKKACCLMFINNFGKCGPIFKTLSPKNILYVQTIKISTSSAICCYTTLWKLQIQKCYWFWQRPQQIVDMFLGILHITYNIS